MYVYVYFVVYDKRKYILYIYVIDIFLVVIFLLNGVYIFVWGK